MASIEGSVVIGVDGGGTKTAVVAFRASGDEDGSVLARKVVESSNRNSVGSEAAVAALRNGVTSVLQVRTWLLCVKVIRVCCWLEELFRLPPCSPGAHGFG